jgi:ferredoxin
MAQILAKNKLDEMIARLAADGCEVFGPRKTETNSWYGKISKADEFSFDLVLPDRPLKELFFPRTEPMMKYEIKKQHVDVENFVPPQKQRVIFGARPCDAAALAIDDELFAWGTRDEFWFQRRENSIIVSIACTARDNFCMCTSLKSSPDATAGSDVLLHELADNSGWRVDVVSSKGQEFIDRISDLLSTVGADVSVRRPAEVPVKFDLDTIIEKLKSPELFESDFWKTISARCIGCGVCTFACPTCHCFDIQDEGDVYHGVRRKNWDSCSFAMFTRHASGHNPRPDQASRWRQRIMHKFNYYLEKFGHISCTGCGRCSRKCPVDMGVTQTLEILGTDAEK